MLNDSKEGQRCAQQGIIKEDKKKTAIEMHFCRKHMQMIRLLRPFLFEGIWLFRISPVQQIIDTDIVKICKLT